MTFSFSHEVSPSVCFCACSTAQRGLATLHMLSGRIGPVAVVSDSAVLGFSLLGDSLFPLLKCGEFCMYFLSVFGGREHLRCVHIPCNLSFLSMFRYVWLIRNYPEVMRGRQWQRSGPGME